MFLFLCDLEMPSLRINGEASTFNRDKQLKLTIQTSYVSLKINIILNSDDVQISILILFASTSL